MTSVEKLKGGCRCGEYGNALQAAVVFERGVTVR